MPQLLIPAPLRASTGKAKSVTVPGRTVGEALDALVARHPDLKAQLFDERGALRRYVNVYVRDEDIRSLQHLDTPLAEHDEVQLIPAVSGGAR
jgi:molybdopterin synthase sulfur carrier subunit